MGVTDLETIRAMCERADIKHEEGRAEEFFSSVYLISQLPPDALGLLPDDGSILMVFTAEGNFYGLREFY